MRKRTRILTALLSGAVAAVWMMGIPATAFAAQWTDGTGGYAQAATGFIERDGNWYYYDQYGKMLTGWQEYDDNWYYMDASGKMLTGWQKLDGKWYYLYASGRMAAGWAEIDGKWYYFNGGGVMKTGWLETGGKWYFFNGGGVMRTGWVSNGGKWYYMDADGVMQTGWLQNGGSWYYLDGDGVMQTGSQKIDGVSYTFSSDGVLTSGNPPASASAFDPASVRSLLDGVSLTPRSTADSKLNQAVSSWIAGHLTSSMSTWDKVKAIYDVLLKFKYGTPDDSVIDTSGLSMDELMSLYFDGPEYNARLLLLSGSGTEEHFAAGLASLLRAIGLDAQVAEGIIYQDAKLTTGTPSSWVTVKINGKSYIFDVASDLKAGGGYSHFCRTASDLGNRYQQSDVFAFQAEKTYSA